MTLQPIEVILSHPGIGDIFQRYDTSVAATAATEVYLAMYRSYATDPEWGNYAHDFYLTLESVLADAGSERVVPEPTACYCSETGGTCQECQSYYHRIEYFKTICAEIAMGIVFDPTAIQIANTPGLHRVEVLDANHIVVGVIPCQPS